MTWAELNIAILLFPIYMSFKNVMVNIFFPEKFV